MITVVRTINVQQGQQEAAIAWVNKMAAYIKETYPPVQPSIVRNLSGAVNQLHWIVNWESLSAWEKHREKLAQDPKFHQIAAENKGLFVSTTDNLYETVV
ncbi:MAG: NIPSNAP family protein [Caldilineaceae bacterium]|nr:NIPSNAP family protein [Caldilineaceae bacterium]